MQLNLIFFTVFHFDRLKISILVCLGACTDLGVCDTIKVGRSGEVMS